MAVPPHVAQRPDLHFLSTPNTNSIAGRCAAHRSWPKMLTIDLAEDAVPSAAEPRPSRVLRCHAQGVVGSQQGWLRCQVCLPEVEECCQSSNGE